jgi:iron complex transport system ATP-binding protein
MSPILEVSDISFSYGHGADVFSDISFSVDEGQILTILGANGVGKSTMLNCVTGVLRPQKGTTRLMGRDIAEMSDREVAQLLGYVQQVHTTTYGFKVDEFLLMGRAPHIGATKMPKKSDYDAVYEVMDEMGIRHLADKSYNELSGGERQQVQIGRALVQNPRLIVLDEPTNHLDYGNQYKILKLLKSLSARGFAIILTTHLPDQAILLGGSVGVLSSGGSFEIGTAEELVTTENMRNIYGIELDVFYCDEVERRLCAYKNLE